MGHAEQGPRCRATLHPGLHFVGQAQDALGSYLCVRGGLTFALLEGKRRVLQSREWGEAERCSQGSGL